MSLYFLAESCHKEVWEFWLDVFRNGDQKLMANASRGSCVESWKELIAAETMNSMMSDDAAFSLNFVRQNTWHSTLCPEI